MHNAGGEQLSEAKSDSTVLLCGLVETPHLFEFWNPAMRGAYGKGIQAFIDGKTIDDCPYSDKRKPSGGLSWSRAFLKTWQDGFNEAKRKSKYA